MNCPYCQQKLSATTVQTKAGQTGELYECFSCGGHWFPRWLANDITAETAANIDSVLAKLTISPPKEPRCPVCQTRLSIIKHDAVAKGIVVWACPNAHGNFFPRGELYKFKNAQEAKITYHQLWGVPIRTVFAVLLPVAVVFGLVGGVPLLLEQLQAPQETRTRASATYSTPVVTVLDETSALVSFTTAAPSKSSLTLYQNKVFHSTLVINNDFATRHTVRLQELDPAANYTYSLTLTSRSGAVETTDPIFLPYPQTNLEETEGITPSPEPESEVAPSL